MFPWPHLTIMGTHHHWLLSWHFSSSDIKDTINLSGHPLRIWSSIIWYLPLGLWSHLFYSQFRRPKDHLGPNHIRFEILTIGSKIYQLLFTSPGMTIKHPKLNICQVKFIIFSQMWCIPFMQDGNLLPSNCGILINSLSIFTASQTQHSDTSSLSFHLSYPFLLLCFVVFLLPWIFSAVSIAGVYLLNHSSPTIFTKYPNIIFKTKDQYISHFYFLLQCVPCLWLLSQNIFFRR